MIEKKTVAFEAAIQEKDFDAVAVVSCGVGVGAHTIHGVGGAGGLF